MRTQDRASGKRSEPGLVTATWWGRGACEKELGGVAEETTRARETSWRAQRESGEEPRRAGLGLWHRQEMETERRTIFAELAKEVLIWAERRRRK